MQLAPAANFANTFYGNESAANMMSLMYMATTIPLALPAMYLTRRMGLRFSIRVAGLNCRQNLIARAGFMNLLGASIRVVGVFVAPEWRYVVSLAGAGTAGVAYPFIMFLPAKIGAAWFDDRQRAIATAIATLANPLGVLLPNLITPSLVRSMRRFMQIYAN